MDSESVLRVEDVPFEDESNASRTAPSTRLQKDNWQGDRTPALLLRWLTRWRGVLISKCQERISTSERTF